MTLFPQLADTFYVDNDNNLLKFWDYCYAKYIQINQSNWSEGDVDTRFYVGDQTLWNDIYGNLPAFRKRQFTFNRIMRTVNMISGYQRQHRKSTICTPIESSDEVTADQFTKLLYHVNSKGHVLDTISEAFEGACIAGMNLLSICMDYTTDPVNGDIKVDNLGYNAYLIDPYFKKMDLSDCNALLTRKYLSRQQVMQLLPGRKKEIEGLSGWGNRDGKFQFMAESYNYGMQDLIIWDEIWYLDSRPQTMVVDIQTGESKEWSGTDEMLGEYLRRFPTVRKFDHEIPTVKLGIIVQGKVMYQGPNPLGIDRYPFVPVWGYYQPQMPYFPWRVQGVVRGLRDAQYLYNRRRIIELDILESQMTSGFIFKEDALVNPTDVFLQGQGRGLALKQTQEAIESLVKKIDAPQIPPSMIQLSELLGKEVMEISGVNEELLGSATDDKAGILGMLRQGAGLTTLQTLFDNLDRAQKLLGDITIDLIQKWTPGKVKRILGEEPSQQFFNHAFNKYDSIVEEGLNTATQRQLEFAQLLQLREMGVPVPTETLINVSTLQGKKKLVEGIVQQEQQAAQMQQQKVAAEIELLKAQIHDLQARAMSNEGLGVERASRVAENQALAVERVAAAQKDRDLGTLEKLKAVKELGGIDLDHISRALEIINQLQAQDTERAVASTQSSLARAQ